MAIPSPEPNGGQGQYTALDQWGRPVTVTNYAPGVQDRTAWYNVWKYYQPGNDGPDHAPMFRRAVAAAKAAGGGIVYAPAGLYTLYGAVDAFGNTTGITLPSYVSLRGDGYGATVLQLANGQNCDLVQGENAPAKININAAYQSGAWQDAIEAFTISDLTLDGNGTNQSGGPSYALRLYAFGYTLRDMEVRNGYSGGILSDFYGAYPSSGNAGANNTTNPHRVEATYENVMCHTNTGPLAAGIEFYGPHDSRWTNVLSYINSSHSVHVGPNAGGLQAVGCHAWQSGSNPNQDVNSCSWLQEASMYADGCEAEGSPFAQLVILAAGVVWNGGSVYAGAAAGLGIQLGQQAGLTPYTRTANVNLSGGLTKLTPVSSYVINTLIQNITHTTGAIWFNQDAGGLIIARILAASGTNTIYTGTVSIKSTLILNNQGFNDLRQQIVLLGGQFSLGVTNTASDPGTGGTIATSTSVVRLNPAAAETGVILQQGTVNGQLVTLVNESAANSITFATGSTSNVADGTSDVIAANTARLYVWVALELKWYRCG